MSRRDRKSVKPLWKVLLPLRGIAIVLVVVGHCAILLGVQSLDECKSRGLSFTIGEQFDFPSPIYAAFLEAARAAVPLFLFLCGHFIATRNLSTTAVWRVSRKLIYPFVFWSLVAWAISWRRGSGGWSLSEFLIRLYSGEAQLGYYFIVLVIQYYLLAALLVSMSRRYPVGVVFTALFVQAAVQLYDYWYLYSEVLQKIAAAGPGGPFPEYWFPRFLLPVSMGVWAGLHPQKTLALLSGRFCMIALGAVVAFLLMMLEAGAICAMVERGGAEGNPRTAFLQSVAAWKISTTVWSVLAILLVLGASLRWMPRYGLLERLGKEAYTIFLLHGMVVIPGVMLLIAARIAFDLVQSGLDGSTGNVWLVWARDLCASSSSTCASSDQDCVAWR